LENLDVYALISRPSFPLQVQSSLSIVYVMDKSNSLVEVTLNELRY